MLTEYRPSLRSGGHVYEALSAPKTGGRSGCQIREGESRQSCCRVTTGSERLRHCQLGMLAGRGGEDRLQESNCQSKLHLHVVVVMVVKC